MKRNSDLYTDRELEVYARANGYGENSIPSFGTIADFVLREGLAKCEVCNGWGIFGHDIFIDPVSIVVGSIDKTEKYYCKRDMPKWDLQ